MAVRRLQGAARPLRIYVDTSVFGGVHDQEFREASERFFTAVRRGAFVVLVSEALIVEIGSAPAVVQATFEAHRATWKDSRQRPRLSSSPRRIWQRGSFGGLARRRASRGLGLSRARRLASQAPLWESLVKARTDRPPKPTRARGKRRSTG